MSEGGKEGLSKPPSDGGTSCRAQGALLVVLEMAVHREVSWEERVCIAH